MAEQNTITVENATCTFCGCVCDDMILTVDLDEKRITKAKNACILGRAWFAEHTIEDAPAALIGGKEATVDEAVEEAAGILAKARFPITYGLSDTTCEAQRVAVAITDMIHGTIDTTPSVCHGPLLWHARRSPRAFGSCKRQRRGSPPALSSSPSCR